MGSATKAAGYSFGEWVRRRREELALPLRRAAQAAGIDPGNLSRYERGVLPPPQDVDFLDRLAEALQLGKGTDQRQHLMDLAAASAGRIPPDLAEDPALLGRLPVLFRAARKTRLSRAELIDLLERLRKA